MRIRRARAERRIMPAWSFLCLALACSITVPLQAQTVASSAGSDHRQLLSFGVGLDPIEPTRWQLDVLLSDRLVPRRYTLATSARYGRYSPDKLVGESRAALDGFSDDVRKDFWSLYVGLQGQAPIVPSTWGLYARLAAGGSAYMGQQFRDAPPGGNPSQIQRKVVLRLAPGVEAAVGRSWPGFLAGIGLRAELRIGYEQVPRSDRQGINSMVVLGGTIPF